MSAVRGADRLTLAAALLCLAGLAIAGYLTYVHYAEIDPACTTEGCERVQASDYSEIAGERGGDDGAGGRRRAQAASRRSGRFAGFRLSRPQSAMNAAMPISASSP